MKWGESMRVMKNMLFWSCAALLCTGCAARSTTVTETGISTQTETKVDENLITVGFSQVGAESDWRAANTESVRSSLTEENGFYLMFEDAQQKQENQIKAVRDFILQEVDYIVLSPIVETGWDAVLQEAREAQIPVILIDRMAQVDEELYTCWIGADFEKEGETAGKWLADYLEDQGRGKEKIQIVTLQGTLGSSAQIGRTEGFAQIMREHGNWTMLDMQDGNFTQAKGQEVMEEFLQKYPDIDVVVCENDNMAFGAIEVIKEAGRTCGPGGEITILSFDGVQAAFDAMIDGDINAVFECNPLHGPRLAQILKDLENGETVDKVQYMEETYFDTNMDLEAIRAERTY